MKTLIHILTAASTLALLHAQGPLTPPGVPAPTMKSLDQVEPRTPISSLPYAISASGSYYFTKNLQFTAASGNAITISASDVTLDLGGFTLSSTAGVTAPAIYINPGSNVTVRNGNIAGNTTVTITGTAPSQTWTPSAAGFQYGIIDHSTAARFHDLSIRGCREAGLFSSTGGKSIVDKVTATSNGGYGIRASYGSVSNSTASSNSGYGIYAANGSVTNSTATSNSESGIYAYYGSVTNSAATSNGAYGINATYGSITNSTATTNGDYGINAAYSSVTNSTASSNVNSDIFAPYAVVAFCRAVSMVTSGSAVTGNLSP